VIPECDTRFFLYSIGLIFTGTDLMIRRSFLYTAAAMTAFLIDGGLKSATSKSRTNFIVLFADDLGYGDLGCFGHPTICTPNLDRMAAEGMKLTQFYAAASVCTPSRAGLMTGRLPVRSGMCSDERAVLFPDSDGGLPQNEITVSRVLKQGEYATACIGKWHLGHRHPYLPTDHGFDFYFGIPYSNDMSPAQNEWEGARNFPPTPLMRQDIVVEEEPDQRLLTRRYTAEALSFIRANQNRPFFLYLPYTFPHTPLYASSKFKNSRRGLYGDVVEELDWSVGRIINEIRLLGLEQKTLVFFTSDNGPWLLQQIYGGSSGLLREGKYTTWEGGMREPAIAWWPGTVPPGTVCGHLASTLDLFATFTSLAGLSVPQDRLMDSFDMTPLLTRQEPVRESLFYYRGEQLYAVRKGPWKAHFKTMTGPYTVQQYEEHDPPLLFHLEQDPSEKYNVADKFPDVIREIDMLVEEHNRTLIRKPSMLEKRMED
jgi:arylsulfatase A